MVRNKLGSFKALFNLNLNSTKDWQYSRWKIASCWLSFTAQEFGLPFVFTIVQFNRKISGYCDENLSQHVLTSFVQEVWYSIMSRWSTVSLHFHSLSSLLCLKALWWGSSCFNFWFYLRKLSLFLARRDLKADFSERALLWSLSSIVKQIRLNPY